MNTSVNLYEGRPYHSDWGETSKLAVVEAAVPVGWGRDWCVWMTWQCSGPP